MARRNADGKYILSAGEVGAYTVCSESWRLKVVERKKTSLPRSTESREGIKLHERWSAGHEEVIYLTYAARALIGMVLILLVWIHSK